MGVQGAEAPPAPGKTHFKKVFSPDIGVEALSQVLAILAYACGLILGFALISNENPNFEMGFRGQTQESLLAYSLRYGDIANPTRP